MDRPPIRGDEVRQGKFIYLDAVSDAVRDTLGDDPLPESLLYQLVEDDRPIAPMTARQVYQTYKDAGELGFALRLSTDKTQEKEPRSHRMVKIVHRYIFLPWPKHTDRSCRDKP